MKKFQNLSLLVALCLASLLIYSCMKDEVITQQPVALEPLQAQTLTSTTDNTIPITEVKSDIKKLPQAIVKSTTAPQIVTLASSLNGIDGDCTSPPKDPMGCSTIEVTAADNITIDMPPTTRNPIHTVAIVAFTMTICKSGNTATISYRNVRVVNRDNIPEDLLALYWATLDSPDLDEALDEYDHLGGTRMENMVTRKFLDNNPTIKLVESRYFKALCYTTCIFKEGEKLKTAKTTCGDKCCKRVKLFRYKNEEKAISSTTMGYFETGLSCGGGVQDPCKNAIKITSICSHECVPPHLVGTPDE